MGYLELTANVVCGTWSMFLWAKQAKRPTAELHFLTRQAKLHKHVNIDGEHGENPREVAAVCLILAVVLQFLVFMRPEFVAKSYGYCSYAKNNIRPACTGTKFSRYLGA